MIQRHFASIAERIALITLSETERVQEAASSSPEGLEQAIMREWNALQQVPSYVEKLLEANRGLIESIATQQ